MRITEERRYNRRQRTLEEMWLKIPPDLIKKKKKLPKHPKKFKELQVR